MSSTNRGGQRSDADFYSTPPWVADAVLSRLGPLNHQRILEPSAGTGALIKRMFSYGAHDEMITAVEIDEERAKSIETDAGVGVFCGEFESFHGRDYDLIVMNPPFALAEPHIRRAISLLKPGGTCAALVRLSFALCSKARAPLRAAHPCDLLVLARRPSFTGNGSDSADYAWALYGEGRGGRFEVFEGGP